MTFESMLRGGHPNSLGNTLEVVSIILKDKTKLEELYNCYFSDDEVVRLRVSNAFKRICKERKDWLVPFIDRFINKISFIDQPSTKWTLAQLFLILADKMTSKQIDSAKKILKNNLIAEKDWIVQNHTMQTLFEWSLNDKNLQKWLIPELIKATKDSHKSISGRAIKLLNLLNK